MSGNDLPPPAKPKLSAQERRAREADRLMMIRLRMTIGRELDDRGITTPAAMAEALGMPAAEAANAMVKSAGDWPPPDATAVPTNSATTAHRLPVVLMVCASRGRHSAGPQSPEHYQKAASFHQLAHGRAERLAAGRRVVDDHRHQPATDGLGARAGVGHQGGGEQRLLIR